MVSFSATATTQHTVDLAWTTSLETNNKGFQLDRSKDLVHFETVGQIPAEAANSQAIKHYQFTDQTPFTGTSYYRLTQTDLSGKATVYPAVSVVIRDEAYGVYPNPVANETGFVLRLDEPQTAILGFFSPQGRAIPLQKMGLQSGNLLLKASGSLAAGVYVLTVEERGQTRQHRLVVQ
ncbi:T9SS type A sorting domain-containing protein [Spirosoma fluviale]|uniref:Por secretion system C-terminal sorting domain-containing protein n=1 Tax=Spirosoma fluviale TaxID=1597977 RepID=A0A286G4J4_9BACT|nr:T9SS type A sorting domain-containing protein [Spirosoma fluviale]SOD90408.1 Por secretion system C-terminal sorting domain-containing protein [Spirosoma fluviale]